MNQLIEYLYPFLLTGGFIYFLLMHVLANKDRFKVAMSATMFTYALGVVITTIKYLAA